MSGRRRARNVAHRVIGVPDATEVSETLARLQGEIDALRRAHEARTAEFGRLHDELARQQAVILEQASALEQLQSRLTARPDR